MKVGNILFFLYFKQADLFSSLRLQSQGRMHVNDNQERGAHLLLNGVPMLALQKLPLKVLADFYSIVTLNYNQYTAQ